jgi:hypothetical protein
MDQWQTNASGNSCFSTFMKDHLYLELYILIADPDPDLIQIEGEKQSKSIFF